MEALTAAVQRNRPSWLSAASATTLLANFGTTMPRILALADADPSLRACVAGTDVTLAEVASTMSDEMAQTMSDVVFRRTELGTGGNPGEAALADVAAFMQKELSWTPARAQRERRAVDEQLARYLASADSVATARPGSYTSAPACANLLGQTA
jgi:glycerol-3-phosphate dehydrogenase